MSSLGLRGEITCSFGPFAEGNMTGSFGALRPLGSGLRKAVWELVTAIIPT